MKEENKNRGRLDEIGFAPAATEIICKIALLLPLPLFDRLHFHSFFFLFLPSSSSSRRRRRLFLLISVPTIDHDMVDLDRWLAKCRLDQRPSPARPQEEEEEEEERPAAAAAAAAVAVTGLPRDK